jgi:hypothetical protein
VFVFLLFSAPVHHVLKWVFLFLRRKNLGISKATPREMNQLAGRKKSEMHVLKF